jgi:glycosyltransferase involved in cell wall biosynthesis
LAGRGETRAVIDRSRLQLARGQIGESEASLLHVIHVLAPAPAGGVESVVALLAPGLVEAGVQTTVLLVLDPSAPPHPLESDLRDRGVKVRTLRLGGRAYLREYREVGEACADAGARVVHTHGYRPDVVAGAAARGAGLPTVSTVHGFTGGGWRNRIYERIQCLALRRADRVIAVSRPLGLELERRGVPGGRIEILPNAWAPYRQPLARAEARAELGLSRDATIVGWVGRLQGEKAPDLMLEAFARLALPGTLLSFIGTGRDREVLEEVSRARGLPVRFHGLVPDAGRLLRAFDCLVLSSRTEGTPMILFEAMGAGVPVVSTRVGGVPDVVEESEAILIPPGDAEALAQGIRRCLANPEAAGQRAALARVKLLERYAPGPWVARHVQLYRRLASLPSGATR